MPRLLQCQISGKVIGQWIFESPLWSLINQYNSKSFPLLWTSSLPASTNSTEHSSGCRLHDLALVLLLPSNTPHAFFRESYFNFSPEAKVPNNFPPSLQRQHNHLPLSKAQSLLPLPFATPSLTCFPQSSPLLHINSHLLSFSFIGYTF